MIKFFRSIRQNLLNEGKTSRYFKYAIGEIILVVIGILIALQINNWNEGRKATKQEIKILNELKNDLKTNLIEAKLTYNTTNKRQLYTVLILDYFEKELPLDDSLKKAFEHIKMDGLFNIANTAYKFIESEGIYILSNDSLRVDITEMYERHFKNIIHREAKNWKIVEDELLPIMNEHFKVASPIDMSVNYSSVTLNTPKNIKLLRNNDKFKSIIVRLQSWLSLRLYWQKIALTNLEKLIIDIQEEIERLSN